MSILLVNLTQMDPCSQWRNNLLSYNNSCKWISTWIIVDDVWLRGNVEMWQLLAGMLDHVMQASCGVGVKHKAPWKAILNRIFMVCIILWSRKKKKNSVDHWDRSAAVICLLFFLAKRFKRPENYHHSAYNVWKGWQKIWLKLLRLRWSRTLKYKFCIFCCRKFSTETLLSKFFVWLSPGGTTMEPLCCLKWVSVPAHHVQVFFKSGVYIS